MGYRFTPLRPTRWGLHITLIAVFQVTWVSQFPHWVSFYIGQTLGFSVRVHLAHVVVVMTSPSGTAYMGGQRGPEEIRNSTRLWIWRDPSLPRGSWQPFINWGTTQGRLLLPTADILSTIMKQSMLTMSTNCQAAVGSPDSVVGFTGQKTQPTASKYWRKMWIWPMYSIQTQY